jgi:Rrf2 family protein
MVEIAKRPGTDPVSLGIVSENTSISKPYLDQVAIGLKTSALIRSTRGRGGGYQLNRPADEISVRQIIEAAIGPINVVECVRCPEMCLTASQRGDHGSAERHFPGRARTQGVGWFGTRRLGSGIPESGLSREVGAEGDGR